ncbi:MAG: hypothetical protein AAF329_14930 [Cyanobacteria bacterium P01_A01_bin.17]
MVNKSLKGFLNLVTVAVKIEICALLILGMLVLGYASLVSLSDPAPPVPEKSPETEDEKYFHAQIQSQPFLR